MQATGLAMGSFTASKPGIGSFTGLRPARVGSASVPAAPFRAARSGYRPLKVVAVDYPRPEIDNTTNFLEAAALSAYMRDAARPEKPLKVVIAGAGESRTGLVLRVYGGETEFWLIVNRFLQC